MGRLRGGADGWRTATRERVKTVMSSTINSVLLPTDGSDGAFAGAKRGVDLAETADATVHVLSAVDTSEVERVASVLESDVDEQRAALEADAESAVESVTAMIRDRNSDLEVTTATDRGTPYRVIDRYIEANGIDAVAMGTRGRTGLRRIVLGSVTENVLRTVSVPVLVVPPAASDSRLREATVESVLLPTDGSDGAAVAVDWGIALAATFDAMVHAIYSVDTSRFPTRMSPGEVLSTLESSGEDALESVRERARSVTSPSPELSRRGRRRGLSSTTPQRTRSISLRWGLTADRG